MRSRSDGLTFSGTATATAPAGSVDLAKYPTLAYAPAQWGPGVRLARDGRRVSELCAAGLVREAGGSMAGAAEHHGLTLDELCDVILYGRSEGLC